MPVQRNCCVAKSQCLCSLCATRLQSNWVLSASMHATSNALSRMQTTMQNPIPRDGLQACKQSALLYELRFANVANKAPRNHVGEHKHPHGLHPCEALANLLEHEIILCAPPGLPLLSNFIRFPIGFLAPRLLAEVREGVQTLRDRCTLTDVH